MPRIEKVEADELPSGMYIDPETDDRPFVVVDVQTHVSWEGDVNPNDSWDRPDTDSTFDGVKVYAGGDGYSSKFPVREPVAFGDDVYVVLVSYSTGDTFGNDSGNVAAVGVEVEAYMAEVLEAKVRARCMPDYTSNSRRRGYSFDPRGNEIEVEGWAYYLGSWLGYFENVESVWTEKVRVR